MASRKPRRDGEQSEAGRETVHKEVAEVPRPSRKAGPLEMKRTKRTKGGNETNGKREKRKKESGF